jgi:hypothetical protein
MAAQHNFRVVQQCPVGVNLAPYIEVIAQDAHAGVASIYRGRDAEFLLNKYGKHSQAQLYDGFIRHLPGFLPANPPGFSTHEQRSDGVAYPHYARGSYLLWWMCGFDVNDADVRKCIEVAGSHGWHLWRPYSSGLEWHHLNFASEPIPHSPRMALRVIRLRETLPRN